MRLLARLLEPKAVAHAHSDVVTVRAPGRTPDRPCADCLDHPPAAGRTGSAAASRVAFWLAALILSITMLGTTLPTPLQSKVESILENLHESLEDSNLRRKLGETL